MLTPTTPLANKRSKPIVPVLNSVTAVLIPIWLLLAHLAQGGDLVPAGIVFSVGMFAILAVLLINTRLEGAPNGMAVIAGVFIVWFALGLFGDWPRAGFETIVLAAAGAVCASGFIVGASSSSMKAAWSALVWGLLLFSFYALMEYSTDRGASSGRLYGGFGSPNTAATLFGIACLIALSKILHRLEQPKLRRLMRGDRITRLAQTEYASIMLVVIAGMCLILTVSRAGILISLIALLSLLYIELKRVTRRGRAAFIRRSYVRVPIALLAFAVLLLALTGDINPQASESLFHNLGGRLSIYEHYLTLWLERPAFGHGLGSFDAVNDASTNLQNAASLTQMGAAHNVVVQWLVQQGLIGVLVMAAIITVIHVPIVRALKRSSSVPRHFLRLSIAISVLVFAHGMFDYALEIPSVMWTYAFVLGLAAGFATSSLNRTTTPVE